MDALRRHAVFAFLHLSVLVWAGGAVRAATIYVATCGKNSNTGLQPNCTLPNGTPNPNGPKATIHAGVLAAAVGDTVEVADGVYAAKIPFAKNLVLRSASGNPRACIIDAAGQPEHFGVRFVGTGPDVGAAILEGFTIRNARGGSGGGLVIKSPATIRNCIIEMCIAVPTKAHAPIGAGAFCGASTTAAFENCLFRSNSAEGYGGGYYGSLLSLAVFRNCTFEGNQANNGGGLYCFIGTIHLVNCRIVENTTNAAGLAPPAGGGVFVSNGRAELVNCIIQHNRAVGPNGFGGGIAMVGPAVFAVPSRLDLFNCVVFDNSAIAAESGGSATAGGVFNLGAAATIINSTIVGNTAAATTGGYHEFNEMAKQNTFIANSVFWANLTESGSAQIHLDDVSNSVLIRNSAIQNGCAGITGSAKPNCDDSNLQLDPLFVNLPTGDLRLRFQSPLVDRGDASVLPTDDLDIDDDGNTAELLPLDAAGETRMLCEIDIGAFEHPRTDATCPADIAGGSPDGPDCIVSVQDMLLVLNSWSQISGAADCAQPPCGDGLVNVEDLLLILSSWGACPDSGCVDNGQPAPALEDVLP